MDMEKEFLIIRLSSIGDVLHCTPVAAGLKEKWPDCRITWLVGAVSADVIRCNPYVDEVIVWPREEFEKSFRCFDFHRAWSLWRQLRDTLSQRSFFAVLDIHGLFLTGVIAGMPQSSLRIGMKGTREGNSLFMTKTAAAGGLHITERYLGVLSLLGITDCRQLMTLVVPEKSREFGDEILRQLSGEKKIAVLAPGTTWPAKTWPARCYAELAALLYPDFHILLCGGKADKAAGAEIEEKAAVPVTNVIGRTGLLELAGILAGADILIAGDTGPLHMAAALGIPTAAVFGPTNPAVYAPRGPQHVVLTAGISCSYCHKMVCPKGRATCMNDVLPTTVADAVVNLLQENEKNG